MGRRRRHANRTDPSRSGQSNKRAPSVVPPPSVGGATATSSTPRRRWRRPSEWFVEISVPAVVRGASAGFSVLFVGELAALLLSALTKFPDALILPIVAAAAYTVAGMRAARGAITDRIAHGALAAFGAYALMLPLRVALRQHVPPVILAVNAVVAIVVGAMAGRIVERARRRNV